MKKFYFILTFLLIMATGCNKKELVQEKYTYNFFGTFDTVVYTVMYAENQEKANEYNSIIENRFNELHREFDKYHNYENINNIKTINDKAGKEAVKVSDNLFNLIKTSIDYYNKYSTNTDISFGAVLGVWSHYRDKVQSIEDLKDYKAEDLLPTIEELNEKNLYTGIEHIILNEEEKTVYIDNENTQIDVGAIAKGYAVEIVCNELKELGCDSLLVSAGGNVKSVGHPHDGVRAKWGVGIQNPDILYPKEGEANIIETLFVAGECVVTSGDYQRYFTVEGKNYHHLIDTKTLFPGDYFRAVTVVSSNSALADFLSTSIFLMPYEEGIKLVDSLDGVEALWINRDGSMIVSEGLKKIMLSQGGTGGK